MNARFLVPVAAAVAMIATPALAGTTHKTTTHKVKVAKPAKPAKTAKPAKKAN